MFQDRNQKPTDPVLWETLTLTGADEVPHEVSVVNCAAHLALGRQPTAPAVWIDGNSLTFCPRGTLPWDRITILGDQIVIQYSGTTVVIDRDASVTRSDPNGASAIHFDGSLGRLADGTEAQISTDAATVFVRRSGSLVSLSPQGLLVRDGGDTTDDAGEDG